MVRGNDLPCPDCGESYHQHHYRDLLDAYLEEPDAHERLLHEGRNSRNPAIRAIAYDAIMSRVAAGQPIAVGKHWGL